MRISVNLLNLHKIETGEAFNKGTELLVHIDDFFHCEALADGVKRFFDDEVFEIFDMIFNLLRVFSKCLLRFEKVLKKLRLSLIKIFYSAYKFFYLLNHIAILLSR